MLSKTRGITLDSHASRAIPSTNGRRASGTENAPAPPPAGQTRETRRERSRRKAHRSRLNAYAIVGVALVAFLLALAASNTARVNVNWVFGSSHVSLVWLVLFAAILGWLLGLLATAAFHWRTRAPSGRGHNS